MPGSSAFSFPFSPPSFARLLAGACECRCPFFCKVWTAQVPKPRTPYNHMFFVYLRRLLTTIYTNLGGALIRGREGPKFVIFWGPKGQKSVNCAVGILWPKEEKFSGSGSSLVGLAIERSSASCERCQWPPVPTGERRVGWGTDLASRTRGSPGVRVGSGEWPHRA